jgi:hypothetical protein
MLTRPVILCLLVAFSTPSFAQDEDTSEGGEDSAKAEEAREEAAAEDEKARKKEAAKSDKARKKDAAKTEKARAKKAKKEEAALRHVPAFSQSLFAFRGMGEMWADPAISRVHRSSRFGGTGAFGTNLGRVLGMEFELGYIRMTNPTYLENSVLDGAGQTSLELVPVTAALTVRGGGERSEVFFGLGGAMVGFNDSSPLNAVAGTKIGLDVRVGTRIRTDFVQESLYPVDRGVQRMDIEIMMGRRQHRGFGLGEGLDLSAWRVGVGVAVRL